MTRPLRWVEVFVPGAPATKGSPRLGRNSKTGGAIFLADSQRLRDWTATLRGHLLAARPRGWPHRDGSVGFEVLAVFVLPRRRKDCPERPTGPPDHDKLARALCDAGTGVLWLDDSQVLDGRYVKRWAASGEQSGAQVRVRVVDQPDAPGGSR